MKQVTYLTTVLGLIRVAEEDGAIVEVGFVPTGEEQENRGETPLLQEAVKQLAEYFAGQRQAFDLPLRPKGTAFQQQVWQQLLQIPYGETRSYGQIAAAVGRPKAARAVGSANHHNPIAIIIPCHRVIGADGKLVGYAGGVEYKANLLQLEK